MAYRNAENYLKEEHPKLFNYIDSRFTSTLSLAMTLANTWYSLSDASWTQPKKNGFTGDANGLITYTGLPGNFSTTVFTEIKIYGADIFHVGLFINGVLASDDFKAILTTDKTRVIHKATIEALSTDDEIDIRMKSINNPQTIGVLSCKVLIT